MLGMLNIATIQVVLPHTGCSRPGPHETGRQDGGEGFGPEEWVLTCMGRQDKKGNIVQALSLIVKACIGPRTTDSCECQPVFVNGKGEKETPTLE